MNVSSAQGALVNAASAATPGSVQGSAALSILKKSMDAEKNAAAQLIAALPQPPQATSGSLGALVDVYA
jgi:hypothetical protein